MEKPAIVYPCWWTYALIGPDEEGIRLAIGAITQGTQHKVQFSKQSKEKNYVSLHVEVWVISEEQRNELFQAFKADSASRSSCKSICYNFGDFRAHSSMVRASGS